jgi:hypothetical protein
VWSTFSPQLKASDGKKLFMLTTQIDSFGVFTDYAQGAYSRITGLVTVLAAAQTLQKVCILEKREKKKKNEDGLARSCLRDGADCAKRIRFF